MENRTINPKPTAKFFTNKFFKEFENWYDDRILGRSDLINKWAIWNGKIFNVLISKNVVKGKEGYLFSPINMSHKLVDSDKKLGTLQNIEEQCSKRGIRFIFMLTPNSELVLSDLFTEKYPQIDLASAEQTVAKELDKRKIEHCFMGKEFTNLSLNERKNMYYEGDYHWTMAGGYLASQKFLKQVGLDNKINSPIKPISFKSKEGTYFRDIGLPIPEITHSYPWSENFDKEFYLTDNRDSSLSNGRLTTSLGNYGQHGEDIIVNNKAPNKTKLLIIGDSFSSALKPYLIQDVNTIVYSHSRDIQPPKKKIDITYLLDHYKPDIVLFSKMESYFFWETYETMLGNMKI